jgi:hypothetical protein
MIEDFIVAVKQECVMNQHYFSFYDIPDLIIKKKVPRKDYETIILKMLMKVKMCYLEKKLSESKDKKTID